MTDYDRRASLAEADRLSANIEQLRHARDQHTRWGVRLLLSLVVVITASVLVRMWVHWVFDALTVLGSFCLGVLVHAIGMDISMLEDWRRERDEHMRRAIGERQ